MATMWAWHLVARPHGFPEASDFELREVALPPLREGEMLVRNTWVSVDPYMRGRMGAAKGYDAFPLGHPMDGPAMGEVVESKAPGFVAGDIVTHFTGWRDLAVVPAVQVLKKAPPGLPQQTYLSVLGGTGLTGYFGLVHVAGVRPGDVVFVSGAGGAVGSTVVQLAKVKGASRVIGSAGGPEKARWLKEIGCDAVIDYRTRPDLEAALAEQAPDGIDVYFDNVGGEHLFAAIACANQHARFAECGMIGGYNTDNAFPPRDLMQIVVKRIRIEGFGGDQFFDRLDEFYAEMTPLVASGRIRSRETVVDGLENAPQAFRGLFTGENIGKMLVKLA